MPRHHNFGRQPSLSKSLQAGVSAVPADRRKAWRQRQQEKFTRWATLWNSDQLVRLIRVETLEVGASKEVLTVESEVGRWTNTKGVLFRVAPQAQLFNGTALYVNPRFQSELVFCAWETFLRLTRWHKGREDLLPEQQAETAVVVEARTLLRLPGDVSRTFLWEVKALRPGQMSLFAAPSASSTVVG